MPAIKAAVDFVRLFSDRNCTDSADRKSKGITS
jgi:hypothetical protein